MQQPPTSSTDLIFDIETLVSVAQPKSILVIGNAPENFLNDYCSQCRLLGQEVEIEQLSDVKDALENPSQQQFDMGIVLGGFEHLSKQSGGQLIGHLRDIQCRQFCLAITLDKAESESAWSLIDMLGFGLRRVAQYDAGEEKIGLFKYRLKDYKKTPEWLNPNNWANPEMWGKYWW